MKTDVYNLKNEVVGTVEVPERVFGAKWNEALVKQVLDAQVANRRDPWAHVKDRSEVSGGGIKPWRQKGTGRARAGSSRSPLWRHGGKAHGPRNEKDYSQKVNKKMRRVAFFAALSKKMKDGEMKFFENFEVEAPKTKIVAKALHDILGMKKGAKRYDVLVIANGRNESFVRGTHNLQKAKTLDAASLNMFDIVNHKHILIEKEAALMLDKHYKV